MTEAVATHPHDAQSMGRFRMRLSAVLSEAFPADSTARHLDRLRETMAAALLCGERRQCLKDEGWQGPV